MCNVAPAVFLIGRVLRGRVDETPKTIFGRNWEAQSAFDAANRAVEFFDAQCKAARLAIDTWCLIVCRINNKVNKDIRKSIGQIIWTLREEANYKDATTYQSKKPKVI
jgi:hypothetical protein